MGLITKLIKLIDYLRDLSWVPTLFLTKNINYILDKNNMQYNILFENKKIKIKEKHDPNIVWKKI